MLRCIYWRRTSCVNFAMALALSASNVPMDDGRPKSDNPFEDFFGPLPPGLVNTSAGAAYPHESYALPFAYQGRNLFLSSVIDFLICSNDSFLTTEICPVVQTDEIHVSWNTFRFDRVMADFEPEFGMPRFVTAESSSSSDSLARRGLAMQLEYGFWKTPLGRQHYLMNLQQIQEACLETLQYGVVHAILSSKNEWRSWLLEHGNVRGASGVKELLKTRKQEWAIVQRDPKGMFLLDAQIKDHMRSRGIEPDRWLLAPRTAMYFSMVSDFQTEYYRRGPKADVNLQKGANAMNPFRGTQVREVRKFDMDFCNKPSCPLSRPRSIGSYFIMEPDDEFITVYCMEKDCWVTHSKQAICDAAELDADTGKRLLIMRFSENYQMGSGVLCKSGEEFGSTFVGNSDMMLSDNALSKTHIGHFTYYSKTVIRRPELAYIAEDIFCEDYISGEGTKVYSPDGLKKDIDEGRIGTPHQKGDMVAVWLDDDSHVCNPIDIRGSFNVEMTGAADECFKVCQDCEASNDVIEYLQNILPTAATRDEEDAFRVPFARCNVYCYKGAYACRKNLEDKAVMHPNTGFWGPDVYDGCREARTGNLVQLQQQKRGCAEAMCLPPAIPVQQVGPDGERITVRGYTTDEGDEAASRAESVTPAEARAPAARAPAARAPAARAPAARAEARGRSRPRQRRAQRRAAPPAAPAAPGVSDLRQQFENAKDSSDRRTQLSAVKDRVREAKEALEAKGPLNATEEDESVQLATLLAQIQQQQQIDDDESD